MSKKQLHKRHLAPSLLIFFGTAFMYFFLGGATLVIAYHPLGYVKLLTLHTLFFLSLFFVHRFVYEKLHRPSSIVYAALILASYLIAAVLVWEANIVVSRIMPHMAITIRTYIGIGDYLRDVHGINWYYMDWSGWILAVLIYETQVLAALVAVLIDGILRRLPAGVKVWRTTNKYRS